MVSALFAARGRYCHAVNGGDWAYLSALWQYQLIHGRHDYPLVVAQMSMETLKAFGLFVLALLLSLLAGWLALAWWAGLIALFAAYLSMHGIMLKNHLIVLCGGDKHPLQVLIVSGSVLAYVVFGGGMLGSVELGEIRVARVVDGDTVHTSTGEKIRLWGIDAPESRQTYGKEATACLKQILADKPTVNIERVTTDIYQRTVAKLSFGQVKVSAALVAQGCAHALDRSLLEQQAYAQSQGLGLWQYPNPTKPSVWRKKH